MNLRAANTQLTLKLSPFSALYMPHSDNVVFYRDGHDLGFMRWADRSLWVTTGDDVSPDLEPVAASYLAAHAAPADDDAILLTQHTVPRE